MPMNFLEFLILSLAVWRCTSLVVDEYGPWDAFEKLRTWAGVAYDENGQRYGKNELAAQLCCLWCCIPFVALAWMVFWTFVPETAFWAALVFAVQVPGLALNARGVRGRRLSFTDDHQSR